MTKSVTAHNPSNTPSFTLTQKKHKSKQFVALPVRKKKRVQKKRAIKSCVGKASGKKKKQKHQRTGSN